MQSKSENQKYNHNVMSCLRDRRSGMTDSRNRVRKLPPYGRSLVKIRAMGALSDKWGTSPDGRNPTIIVCAGENAWDAAREWSETRLVVLCPPGEDPRSLDWSCCDGADPVLLWRCGRIDEGHIRELVHAILRDGTNRILDVAYGTRYLAEVRNAAA